MPSTVALRVVHDPSEPGAAEIRVRVEVAGTAYDTLLDTGAGSSRLPADDLTRSFGDAPADVDPGRGVLGGPATPLRRVIVPELRLGDVVATEIVVELADGESGPPSILGLDVLRHHRLDLRLDASTLTIDADELVAESHVLELSSRGHPHLDISWSGHGARGLFDTGAGVSIVDTAFARAHRHLFTPLTNSIGHDAHGNSADLPLVTMAACSIGGRSFGETVAALADIAGIQRPGDPSFDVILGYPLIAQAAWSLDLVTGRWGFL